MFDRETLLVLGAGASVPYGYPTGEKLIQDIVDDICNDQVSIKYSGRAVPNSDNFSQYIKEINILDQGDLILIGQSERSNFLTPQGKNICRIRLSEIPSLRDLKDKLNYFAPVSIDIFLRDNPSFHDAGRFMIVYTLLKRSKRCAGNFGQNGLTSQQKNEYDNWYRHLINEMISGCENPVDICKNKINIVTFNYTVDFEYYIVSRLFENEFFKRDIRENNMTFDQIISFFKERITHVYGQIWGISEVKDKFDILNKLEAVVLNSFCFSEAKTCYSSINLMSHERTADPEIKKIVSAAEDCVVIGFGFDRDNLDKLGFPGDKSSWIQFLSGKIFKYMDYRGKMRSLQSQFSMLKVGDRPPEITCSTAEKISDAYLNDFKIRLF